MANTELSEKVRRLFWYNGGMFRVALLLVLLFPAGLRADFVWGNDDYGYWSGPTILEALPPGRQPLLVFARQAGRCRRSAERLRLSARHASVPVQPGKAEGQFSVPYFLVNGTTPTGKPFIAVLNRKGETVWAHFTTEAVLAVKPQGPGQFALLFPDRLEVVAIDHSLVWKVVPSVALRGDFLFPEPGTRSFLSFSPVTESHRPWWKFWGEASSYESTRVVEIDGANGSVQERWRPPGRGHRSLSSLSLREGGDVLVSSPDTNRLFLLTPHATKLQWSIGRDRDNTFATAESPALFHAQASVVAPTPQHLLIFDNGIRTSRVLLLRIDEANKKLTREQEWMAPQKLFSAQRGSAYALSDKNVLGYFPNAASDTSLPEFLFEFTRDDTEPVARMRLNWGINPNGQRAIPLSALGSETFLGFQRPAGCPQSGGKVPSNVGYPRP